jgi:hypothetical protein
VALELAATVVDASERQTPDEALRIEVLSTLCAAVEAITAPNVVTVPHA